MASLAVLLQKRGHRVTGSDTNVYPPMSTLLTENGLSVNEGYAAVNLDPAPDLVVIGNALSRGNPEVEATLAQGLRYVSMAALLKEHFIRATPPLSLQALTARPRRRLCSHGCSVKQDAIRVF